MSATDNGIICLSDWQTDAGSLEEIENTNFEIVKAFWQRLHSLEPLMHANYRAAGTQQAGREQFALKRLLREIVCLCRILPVSVNIFLVDT